MLEYPGDDLEEAFLQTFQVGYTDGSGAQRNYELVPAGRHRAVGRHNVRVSTPARRPRASSAGGLVGWSLGRPVRRSVGWMVVSLVGRLVGWDASEHGWAWAVGGRTLTRRRRPRRLGSDE